jgi:ferrochelatase
LEDVEDYVLHIRHGRPLPPEQMAAIKERYRQVGGSPLIELTVRQAAALEARLEQRFPEKPKVYIGMRHSHPFIAETIEKMHQDGVTSFAAVCMAPQFSRLTIGAYENELKEAISSKETALQYQLVKSYARHPGLISAFVSRLADSRQQHPNAFVIFTAHSLPERILQEGDAYDYEVKETARLVANSAGLTDWMFAYQSQGMTSEKWLGPAVESRIDSMHSKGIREILIAPIGFVCDHVEILYDIDVGFRNYAHSKEIDLTRTKSLNDSPQFIDLLYILISDLL